MMVIKLSPADAEQVAGFIGHAKTEILVAVDTIDEAFKIKIDGGIWSPPLGKVVRP
jgi:hypothetical protein